MNSYAATFRRTAKPFFSILSLSLAYGLAATSSAQLTPAVAAAVPRTVLPQVELPPVLASSQALGATDPTTVLHMAVSLPAANLAAFQAYADAVSQPGNPLYGHYLTPAQVGAQFGQPAANVQKVVSFLKASGFTVKLVSPNNMAILFEGTVAQAQTAFQTTIGNYHSLSVSEFGRTNYHSPEAKVSVPTTIAPFIQTITGLNNYDIPKALHGKAKQGTSAITVNQTRVLYDTAPLYNAGYTGKGRTVAISNFDGFRLSNLPLEYSTWGLPTPTGGVGSNVTTVTIDGGAGSGTEGAEGDLDIQMELGAAPLSNMIIYDGGDGPLDVLTTEASDNVADIISESYAFGFGASYGLACHQQHLAMTTQGITYMVAAGDSGTVSTTGGVYYPQTDPEVLCVGGTIANISTTGARLSEVAWAGGGGGWSPVSETFNVLPSWQKGANIPTNINFRLMPDIALNAAGAQTGAYQFYFDGSISQSFDGTSFASPVFAGCLTIAEQRLLALGVLPGFPGGIHRLGRLQDLIYKQAGRSDVYFDIVSGTNGTLPNGTVSNAKVGWDFTTGWGAMDLNGFVHTFVPPVTVGPNSVGIYDAQGIKPSGTVSNLASIDSSYYSVESVIQSTLGNVAALTFQFTPQQLSLAKTISFQATGYTTAGSTYFVYVLNPANNTPVLIGTMPLSTAQSTVTFPISNFGSYVDGSGHITVIARAVVPSRSAMGAFLLYLNQVDLYETF